MSPPIEGSYDITGFIDYAKSNMSTNGIPDKFIEDTYIDYGYLSNYVDDAIIIETIKSTNRNNKGLKKLFLQLHRELHGGLHKEHRIDTFVYTNVEINKEYTSDELHEFGQKYQDELNKYSPELIHKNPPSTQAINKLLDKYFEIQKLPKRIHGKKAQITKVLSKKSVLKSTLKLNKEAKRITPEDTSKLLEVQEELYNTTAFIDFLAMDEEPESRISVEEYNELRQTEGELKRLVKQIEKNFELKESNRSYSYIDEWL